MEKTFDKVEKFLRKGFWLTKQNKIDIGTEAQKNWPSESALMRHIITNWFEK